MEELTQEERAELLEIQARGALATAFRRADKRPHDGHWQMLRGEATITVRDIAIIGNITGASFSVVLTETVV